MGINFDGINPESKAKLEQIVSDGKVSQAEYNSLTPAEKEALEKGLAGQIGDDTLDRFKFGSDAPEAKGKEKDWKESLGVGALITGATTLIGGLIGGVAGFFAGGVGAVPGAIAGAKMGAIAGAVLTGASVLTSCSEGGPFDEPDITITDNSKTEVNVQLTVKVEQKITEIDNGKNDEIIALLNSIVDLLKNGNEINQKNNEMLTNILAALTTQNLDNADIKALLQKVLETLYLAIAENRELSEKQTEVMNAILAAINNLDSNISAKLLAIIDKIDSMGENNYNMLVEILNVIKTGNTENNALLEAILNKVIEGNDQNKDMDTKTHDLLIKILKSINSMHADMNAILSKLVIKIDTLSAENKALLEAILAKMDGMDENNQKNFAALLKAIEEGNQINAQGVKVLTAILNKLDKMDASTQANFKAVIDMLMKGNNINAEILAKLEQVLAKLDTIDANQANFFAQVLAKFDKLDAAQQASLQAILDAIANNTAAINKNTEVAEATYELLTKLLDKVDGLNVNVSEILDAIAKISVGGGNVDLSTIEKLLADLLKSSEMNNKVLTDIEAKLDAVAVTIGGIKVALGEGHEKILAKLDEILKKIPNGCHCDVTVIIQKLDELIESIKKNPDDDNKHEGILDDLEDLFN